VVNLADLSMHLLSNSSLLTLGHPADQIPPFDRLGLNILNETAHFRPRFPATTTDLGVVDKA
jgi:hypothetical protein